MRFTDHQWREMDRAFNAAEDRRALARERLAKWRAEQATKDAVAQIEAKDAEHQ